MTRTRKLTTKLFCRTSLRSVILGLSILGPLSVTQVSNAQSKDIEEVSVVGTTPLRQGGELVGSQFATEEDIKRMQSSSLTDLLEQGFLGVTLNQAQNNPLQPDLQYRGFAASSALGLQQGITVYQNGVRLNEPFGDTVNWDLIAKNTISDVQLVSGVNPLFGLNSLGGSLILNTKTGFSNPYNNAEVSFGSFSRKSTSLSFGGNNERFGYFFSADVFDEQGWRDFSESQASNLYGALNWNFDDAELALFYNHGDTDLKGNGSAPAELLGLSRSAVFTHPDRTQNMLDMFNVVFKKDLSDGQVVNANIFYRRSNTQGFNGDGSSYSECDAADFEQFLCIGDDDDDDDDETLELDADDFAAGDLEFLRDQQGNLVSSEFDAINNISERRQKSYGANLEWSAVFASESAKHNLIAGLSYLQGRTNFSSQVEIAQLNEDRSTSGSNFFDPAAATDLLSETQTSGIYLSDTIEVGERWQWVLTARYNSIKIISQDLSGFRPALDAEHRFSRLNIGLGTTVQLSDDLSAYMSAGESMRSPSPVELACSHPDAPCTLPNTFLADPPLDQVVSSTIETGLRGNGFDALEWQAGLFYTVNQNDIVFQTTGGVSSNVGFFDNVGDTRRLGLEVKLTGEHDSFDWYVGYTYLKATFEDSFISSSPNHPLADEGGIQVNKGDSIPSLPNHNFTLGVNKSVSENLSLGANMKWVDGQYLRGDEANLLPKLDSYSVVDMNLNYQFNNSLSLGLEVENVFNSEYNSFGLLGEPDEIFESFTNPVFLSSSAPRGAWVKVSYKW